MQYHNIKRVHRNMRSVQVGRGGKRGKTSGRGGKGQTARAGHKIRPESRDVIKRIPKLRGRGKNIFQSFEAVLVPVNIKNLERHFNAGDTVNPMTLLEKGLVKRAHGRMPSVKILADGELSKKLSFSGVAFSSSARAKIEKAGGGIQPPKP